MARPPALTLEDIASSYRLACNNGGPSKIVRARYRLAQVMRAINKGLLKEDELVYLAVPVDRHYFPRAKDAQVDALMTGLNTEPKIATLLTLGIDLNTGKSSEDFKSAFQIREELKANGVKDLPSVSTFLCYLSRDLRFTGLVAATRLGKGLAFEQSYFRLTEAGRTFGIPAAYQALRRTIAYNKGRDLSGASLLQIRSLAQLGTSKGTRQGTGNRIRILGALKKEEYTPVLDLSRSLHLTCRVVEEHLDTLSTYALVSRVQNRASLRGDPTFLLDYARDLHSLLGWSADAGDRRRKLEYELSNGHLYIPGQFNRALSIHSAFKRARKEQLQKPLDRAVLEFVRAHTSNGNPSVRQCEILRGIPGIGIKTVYNMIQALEDAKFLTRSQDPGTKKPATYYRLASELI